MKSNIIKDYCVCCGHNGSFYPLDYEHTKTKGSGGLDDDSNVSVMCRKCHTEKGNRGISYMSTKYPAYHAWLISKNWFFCNFSKKWRHNGTKT